MSTKPYDQAFKYLAEEDAEGLLLLLGEIRPGESAEIELLPREISVSTQLPDQPYVVASGGTRRLVHVEAQTVYDSKLPERMLDYAVRLWLKHRLPVASYVLLLTDRKAPKNLPNKTEVSAGNLQIELRYEPVCLWKLSAKSALDLKRDSLLPFVPLMGGGSDELEIGVRRLSDIPADSQRQDLTLHFLLLGGLRYNPDELLDLIGRHSMIPIEQLKESSFYEHILEEGRQEGEAALLRRQLEHRFGPLPEWAALRIETADRATLETWGTRFADAASLEDVIPKTES